MVTEHRDSPPIGPDDVDEGGPAPSRRFARLVESPAARRLALPRLAWALGASAGLALLAWAGGSWAIRSVARWVAAQPEHQLPFSGITLVPGPPPWFGSGAPGLLKKVRDEARRGETLPLLELDAEAIRTDFKRCSWVERVGAVRKAYRQLAVHLEYRKPVAVAQFEDDKVFAIAGDAVILDPDDIAWVEKRPRFRVRGIEGPLIVIRGVAPPAVRRYGLAWKRLDAPADDLDGGDPRVLGAARLAEFVQRQPRRSPAGREAPEFITIWPARESDGFFLRDADQRWVYWDRPPGREATDEPPAAEKWAALLDRVDRLGGLKLGPDEFLRFTRAGAEVEHFKKGGVPRGDSAR